MESDLSVNLCFLGKAYLSQGGMGECLQTIHVDIKILLNPFNFTICPREPVSK